jgi:hypothetical protein
MELTLFQTNSVAMAVCRFALNSSSIAGRIFTKFHYLFFYNISRENSSVGKLGGNKQALYLLLWRLCVIALRCLSSVETDDDSN